MTTLEQQRALYEFMFPELEGKEWTLWDDANLFAYDSKTGKGICILPRLYNPDGPDMNTWHYKAVPKLKEDCDIEYKHGHWYVNPWKRPRCEIAHWGRVDPWAATVEWLESK